MTANVMEQQTRRGNLLLAQLAVHERNAIHRGAEAVALSAGEFLLRARSHSEFVFFPVNAVASVVRSTRDAMPVEVALIGNEGMVGLDVITEPKTQLDDVIVISPGWAYRMPAEDLRNQYRRGGGLQRHILRFTGALLAQVSQTAVCSRHHGPEARLARWLLMVNDRTSASVILAAPSSLQTLLAIDAHRISDTVAHLVTARVIIARPETLTIVDREGLEMRACECYETMTA